MFKIFGTVTFVLLLGAAFWSAFKFDDPHESRKRAVSVQKNVAEGVKISRHGIYGIDLVTCGSVRIEKIRMGPFALGAFNVLVMDNLKVILPPRGNSDARDTRSRRSDGAGSALNVLHDIGVGPDFLKVNAIAKRFSGLLINGLELARLDSETNVVHVLTARRAEMKRSGLELSDVSIRGDADGKKIPEAVIKKSRGRLCVAWSNGELFL